MTLGVEHLKIPVTKVLENLISGEVSIYDWHRNFIWSQKNQSTYIIDMISDSFFRETDQLVIITDGSTCKLVDGYNRLSTLFYYCYTSEIIQNIFNKYDNTIFMNNFINRPYKKVDKIIPLEIKLDKNDLRIIAAKGEEFLKEFNKTKFADLPIEIQEAFLNIKINVCKISLSTEEMEEEANRLYRKINS